MRFLHDADELLRHERSSPLNSNSNIEIVVSRLVWFRRRGDTPYT